MSQGRQTRAQDLPLTAAIAFMRSFRGALESGVELPVALSAAAAGLPRASRARVERVVERLGGDYEEDEWGFDEEFTEAAFPFFEFMYDRWWRIPRRTESTTCPDTGARCSSPTTPGSFPGTRR